MDTNRKQAADQIRHKENGDLLGTGRCSSL